MQIAPSNRFTLLALIIVAAGVFFALTFGASRLTGSVKQQATPTGPPPPVARCEKTRWCNTGKPEDVNNDGKINKQDTEDLKNYLQNSVTPKVYASKRRPLLPPTNKLLYPDVSGEGYINNTDLIRVINKVNSQPQSEGEPPSATLYNKDFPTDVNNDGKADIKDAIAVTTYMSSKFCTTAGDAPRCFPDVNNRGGVDHNDWQIVNDWISNPSAWQNPYLPEDVNGDSSVTQADYDVLVTFYSNKSNPMVVKKPAVMGYPDPMKKALYPDVNGDRIVDNKDINQVNNMVPR
ncbi:MAG: hypothetical protein KBC47_04475 [Candidatus Peribacteraceae bacterium]|nr:hypothetical protein [Candidatus Peribacteraceae bacterium]